MPNKGNRETLATSISLRNFLPNHTPEDILGGQFVNSLIYSKSDQS